MVRSTRVIGTRTTGLKVEFPAYDPGVLLVGLTGGIGSGKSAAAEAFAARGVTVVDTDDDVLRDLQDRWRKQAAE